MRPEVGYAGPPGARRLKPGQSGTLAEGTGGLPEPPPRCANSGCGSAILREAYWTIKVSDGSRQSSVPIAQGDRAFPG